MIRVRRRRLLRLVLGAAISAVALFFGMPLEEHSARTISPLYEVRFYASEENFEAMREAGMNFARTHSMEWVDDRGLMPPIRGRKVLVADLVRADGLSIHLTNISPSGAYVAYFYGDLPKAVVRDVAAAFAAHFAETWSDAVKGPLEVRGRSTEE